jgi:acyl-CoA thioesterase
MIRQAVLGEQIRGVALMQEHLDVVRQRFPQDRFATSLGIVLDELTDDTVKLRMRLRPDMLNWFGRPHGAVVYALADAAFSVLTNNKNNLSVALDCSITYHASADVGAHLVVEGETLALTGRTGSFLFRVYAEEDRAEAGDGRALIATMKSVAYRTGRPIDPEVED